MSIFADLFTDMMTNSVTLKRIIGMDRYGAPTYATFGPYTARVGLNPRQIPQPDGQVVVSRGRAWLDTVDEVRVTDKVTFGRQLGAARILAVNQVEDESGPAYTSIDFL